MRGVDIGQMARRPRKTPSKSHDNATVGAVAEATLLCALLSWGFEVFKPMIDVGSDYLAINPKGSVLRIQCKGRAKDKQKLWDIRTNQLDQRHPPTHFYFIHGAPSTHDSWLVPTDVARKSWVRLRTREGTVRVTLTQSVRVAFQPYLEDAGLRAAAQWNDAP